ncbi:MAG TPA: hypothetical protein VID28_08545 [Methylomirabilota bacterium]|jgi:hypothetical protein
MLPGSTGRAGRTGLYRLAATLTAVIVGVMAIVTAVNVPLADRLVVENGVAEWLQVILLAGAGAICVRLARLERATGGTGAPDVLLAAGFAFLVVSEMELPTLLAGRIKIDRLVREVSAGHPRQILFVLVVGGLALAASVYALRHLPELLAWAQSALRTDWGRLFFLAAAVLVVTELFERQMNRMMASMGLPRPLLEETLELVASLYCLLAMSRRPSGRYR